jgi:hypothetical protein
MSSQPRKQSSYLSLASVIVLVGFATGCALGVTRLNVTHDSLATIENKREGDILVKQFVDKRKDTQYIGNKRNMFGMVMGHVGTQEGVKIQDLLTKYFAEALREAGYNAIIQESESPGIAKGNRFDAIVEGEIREFWLDLYMATWHKVAVLVKALDKDTQQVLWEKEVRGEEKNVLWVGVAAEYEKVIREALTKALNQAAKEFASEQFYKALKLEGP